MQIIVEKIYDNYNIDYIIDRINEMNWESDWEKYLEIITWIKGKKDK